jgi:programmed cell death 6-interacting protein
VDLVGPIRSYIENTFSPEEATSSEEDLTRLGLLRSEIVVDQQTHEQRRETLLAYYRALCVVESRFPISKQSGHIDVAFSWADAFKTNKRVSIANVHFEKAAVVFNLGASWSQLGLAADRATPDGIKTAAHAFQQAAGAFTMLRDDVLGKVSGVGGGDATVDLTEECAGMLVSLHLAQAQECFYDKAATDGKSAGILVKLAQQTHLFYEEVKTALASPPLSEHFEKSWSAHVAAKDAMFHAEALSRAAKMAEEDAVDIGSAVARLLVASTELHAAHRLAKNTGGISVHCVGAVATLRDAVDEQLRRAQRDNECVYMERVPAYEDVAPLGACGRGQGCSTLRGGCRRVGGGYVRRHRAGERLQGSEQIHGEGGRAHQGGERRARPRERRSEDRAAGDGAPGAAHRGGGWRAGGVAAGLRPGRGGWVGERAPVAPRRGGGVDSGRGRPRRAEGRPATPRGHQRGVYAADWRG